MAGPFGTSVHTQETSTPTPFPSTYRDHLASADSEAFRVARQIYAFLDEKHQQRRSSALDRCRTRAWFARNNSTGLVRVLSNTCKLRWCPVCAKSLTYFITNQSVSWLDRVKSPKFITFTLRHSHSPLRDQIEALYRFFRHMRTHSLWKRKVKGGIWFFQVKYNPDTDEYHPHLHCLLDSQFIPQHSLSMIWQSITKDSKIVDIRPVRNRASAARYVARYCASPGNIADMPFPQRIALAEALHSRRICGTWGTASNLKLRTRPPEVKDQWTNLGSWWTVTRLSSLDEDACRILDAWSTHKPLPEGITMSPADDFLDDFNAPNIQLNTTPRALSPPLLF